MVVDRTKRRCVASVCCFPTRRAGQQEGVGAGGLTPSSATRMCIIIPPRKRERERERGEWTDAQSPVSAAVHAYLLLSPTTRITRHFGRTCMQPARLALGPIRRADWSTDEPDHVPYPALVVQPCRRTRYAIGDSDSRRRCLSLSTINPISLSAMSEGAQHVASLEEANAARLPLGYRDACSA